MKKSKFVVTLSLLAVLAMPLVANAATTRGGYYVYSTGTNTSSQLYGYIGSSSGTSGITYTDSEAVVYGGAYRYDKGRNYSSTNIYLNPYYNQSGYVENGAKDYKGWTYFRY